MSFKIRHHAIHILFGVCKVVNGTLPGTVFLERFQLSHDPLVTLGTHQRTEMGAKLGGVSTSLTAAVEVPVLHKLPPSVTGADNEGGVVY